MLWWAGRWGCSGSGMGSSGGTGGGGGFDGGDLLLAVGLLGDAELFFHLGSELVGGAAEVAHELAELAGEDGQLLRAEEEQGEEDDEGAVAKPGIVNGMIRLGWGWKQIG